MTRGWPQNAVRACFRGPRFPPFRLFLFIVKMGDLDLSDEGRGRKKHINFCNLNFLTPTQIPPLGARRKKVSVPHFLGKNAKKAPRKLFRGDFGVKKKGVPNRPSLATKSLVYCLCPALRRVLRWPSGKGLYQRARSPETDQLPGLL